MAILDFSPDAFSAYQGLADTPTRGVLLDRIDEVLDLLEKNPGQQRLRRHRLNPPGVWAVLVHAHDETWAILWAQRPEDPDAVMIEYLGPYRL
ncbi:hypothetical protein ACFQ07_20405 [Actinomadura adrarensis]|uniref:Type II toxin-antitoxin system RelE/ParE family toxin n=1 Tax=Actinomadura adrarensis TaxID=1819600 RepID=A0ABW3CM27_9ACTN